MSHPDYLQSLCARLDEEDRQLALARTWRAYGLPPSWESVTNPPHELTNVKHRIYGSDVLPTPLRDLYYGDGSCDGMTIFMAQLLKLTHRFIRYGDPKGALGQAITHLNTWAPDLLEAVRLDPQRQSTLLLIAFREPKTNPHPQSLLAFGCNAWQSLFNMEDKYHHDSAVKNNLDMLSHTIRRIAMS